MAFSNILIFFHMSKSCMRIASVVYPRGSTTVMSEQMDYITSQWERGGINLNFYLRRECSFLKQFLFEKGVFVFEARAILFIPKIAQRNYFESKNCTVGVLFALGSFFHLAQVVVAPCFEYLAPCFKYLKCCDVENNASKWGNISIIYIISKYIEIYL